MSSRVKICVIGGEGAGKTALVKRLTQSDYKLGKEEKTLSDTYVMKNVQTTSGKKFTVSITDTGGESSLFSSMQKQLFSNHEAFIVVFDVTHPASFETAVKRIKVVSEWREQSGTNVPVVLFANKIDDKHRAITTEQVNKIAAELGSSCNAHYEGSAHKSNVGISKCVLDVIDMIITERKAKKVSDLTRLIRKSKAVPKLKDLWTTTENDAKKWDYVINPDKKSDFVNMSGTSIGFNFELGRNDVPYHNDDNPYDIEDGQNDIPQYLNVLSETDHMLLFGEQEPGIGPVFIALETASSKDKRDRRAMVWTKKNTDRILVPHSQATTLKEFTKSVRMQHPEFLDIRLKKVPNHDVAQKELIGFEQTELKLKYKCGFLYITADQTDENEMFSHETHSESCDKFLNLLGNRIKLNGWDGYTGGLDVKTDSTGLESVFATHLDRKIMFHVSTLLPYQKDDAQRVERKRHLGNDVVVVIFREPASNSVPFDPQTITSHFNHVFIIVEPIKELSAAGLPQYKVVIANKAGVRPFGPYLQDPPIFQHDEALKQFILSKIINGERAAIMGGEFRGALIRTRKNQLEGCMTVIKTAKPEEKKFAPSKLPKQRNSTAKLSPEVIRNQETAEYDKEEERESSISDFTEDAPQHHKKQTRKEALATITSTCKQLLQSAVNTDNFDSIAFRDMVMTVLTVSIHGFSGNEQEDIIAHAEHMARSAASIIKYQEKRQDVSAAEWERLDPHWQESVDTFRSRLLEYLKLVKSYYDGNICRSRLDLLEKNNTEFLSILQAQLKAPELDTEEFKDYLFAIVESIKVYSASGRHHKETDLVIAKSKPLLKSGVALTKDPSNKDLKNEFLATIPPYQQAIKDLPKD